MFLCLLLDLALFLFIFFDFVITIFTPKCSFEKKCFWFDFKANQSLAARNALQLFRTRFLRRKKESGKTDSGNTMSRTQVKSSTGKSITGKQGTEISVRENCNCVRKSSMWIPVTGKPRTILSTLKPSLKRTNTGKPSSARLIKNNKLQFTIYSSYVFQFILEPDWYSRISIPNLF